MTENLTIISTSTLNEQTKVQVIELWNHEYPEKLSYKSLSELDAYLDNLSNLTHYLLMDVHHQIQGWAWTFDRAHEKWFAIILSEKVKGRGYGRRMLDVLKQTEPILNGWVIDHDNDLKKNGQPYQSPLKFYEKCGFEIQSEERLELDNISAVKIKWTGSQP